MHHGHDRSRGGDRPFPPPQKQQFTDRFSPFLAKRRRRVTAAPSSLEHAGTGSLRVSLAPNRQLFFPLGGKSFPRVPTLARWGLFVRGPRRWRLAGGFSAASRAVESPRVGAPRRDLVSTHLCAWVAVRWRGRRHNPAFGSRCFRLEKWYGHTRTRGA